MILINLLSYILKSYFCLIQLKWKLHDNNLFIEIVYNNYANFFMNYKGIINYTI